MGLTIFMEYSQVEPCWCSFSCHFLWCTSQRWLCISHVVTSGHDHYFLNCLIGWEMSGNSSTRSSEIKVIMGKHVRNEWEWHGHDMKSYMSKNNQYLVVALFCGKRIWSVISCQKENCFCILYFSWKKPKKENAIFISLS